MKKINICIMAVLVLILGFNSPTLATTKSKQIIDSRYGMNGFDTINSNEKDLTFVFKEPAYMIDMVTGTDVGARKGGGLGGLVWSSAHSSLDYDQVGVSVNAGAFKHLVESANNEGIYQLELVYPLGGVRFLNRKDIASLGNGEFKFKIQKQNDNILEDASKRVVGKRPIVSFDASVNNKPIGVLGGGIKIEIPYHAKPDEDINQLILYKIDELGRASKVENSSYKQISTITSDEHFSVQALVNELGTYAIGYNEVSYKDVSGWYESSANFVLSRGIINDINGLFMPKSPITRGDLAFYLENMSGQNYEVPSSNFKDVTKNHPYVKSIDWAYSTGLIKGYEDGTFKPDKVITRQELAVMLHRYTQAIAKSYMPIINEKIYFKDEKNIGGFAKESVSYLQKAGVIGGRDNGKFDPLANVTRAECAKMITTIIDGIMYGRITIIPID